MILTKNYYLNEATTIRRSIEPMFDHGYSLDIPANEIYSTGWIFSKPDTWGSEGLLITRPDPEYFAPEGIVKGNIIPSINLNDPAYTFSRSNYTYNLSARQSY